MTRTRLSLYAAMWVAIAVVVALWTFGVIL